MSKSNITWTETTWSPVIGCTKVSAGCEHCYAKREVETRWSKNPKSIWYGRRFGDVLCRPEVLAGPSSPLKWKKPRRIFVCPRADLFHDEVPTEFLDEVFAVMAMAPQHTYQVLTKRAARMLAYFSDIDLEDRLSEIWRNGTPDRDTWLLMLPLKNVWIGTSVEDQATADERIPLLLQTPAAVRWISAEPLLGPINICSVPALVTDLDWVVAGGESGPQARPVHPAWARGLRDQCEAAGVPFLFKQWGEWFPADLLPPETALRASQWAAVEEATGRFRTRLEGWTEVESERNTAMGRIGIRKAGRLLDGVLHDGYPEVHHA